MVNVNLMVMVMMPLLLMTDDHDGDDASVADDHDGDGAFAADDHDHSDVDGEGKWMGRIDALGVEPASSVLHCPRSIMEFKQTRGQDGFCGRYQGSNASKRAKRLTMSLAPTLHPIIRPLPTICASLRPSAQRFDGNMMHVE